MSKDGSHGKLVSNSDTMYKGTCIYKYYCLFFCPHERTIRVLSLGKCASTHTQKKSLVYSLIEFKERYLFKGVLVGDMFKASSLNRLIEL